jgi:hypothetical protein
MPGIGSGDDRGYFTYPAAGSRLGQQPSRYRRPAGGGEPAQLDFAEGVFVGEHPDTGPSGPRRRVRRPPELWEWSCCWS